MGHFYYPPPPPIVSATGAQPYAGNKLPPAVTAVQVDNPPFPWQMIPMWGIRRGLPQTTKFLPISVTAVPVTNPPFLNKGRGLQQSEVYLSQPDPWVYTYLGGIFGLQPYGLKALPPSITAVPVNNPPFANEGRGLLQQWPAADPWFYSYLGGGLGRQPYGPETTLYPTAVVTAYPLGTPNDLQYPSIIGSWQFPDPIPTIPRKLSPGIPGQSVDNPPPTFEGRYPNATPNVIVTLWQPPDPQPTLPGKLSPGIPGQSVDFPPFVSEWVDQAQGQIAYSWLSPDPQPQQQGKLSPGVPGQSVDNPPGLIRQLPSVQLEVPYQQPVLKLVQPFVAASLQQAFTSVWLNPVVASWQPPDPQPTTPRNLNPQITAVQVDNPPFAWQQIPTWEARKTLPQTTKYFVQPATVAATQVPFTQAWLATVTQSWQPLDSLPTLPRNLNPTVTAVGVDNPPFGLLVTVVEPWVFTDPLPQVGPKIIVGARTDNPPFSYVGRSGVTAELVQSWQPPDPPPVQRGPLNPSITAVPVNNPPFTNEARTATYWTIMGTWEIPLPPMPQQTQPSYIVTIAPPVNLKKYSYISSSYIQ